LNSAGSTRVRPDAAQTDNDGGDMAVARRATFGFLAMIWLGALAGTAVAAEAELPWQAEAANLKHHTVVANIDQASFDAATARYPQSGDGAYTVHVGRYLMWKIVGLFTSDQRVDLMRLSSFVMSCRSVPAVASKEVICDLNAAILLRQGGRTRVIDISSNRNVGRQFDPAKADYTSVIFAELRDPLDRAVAQIKAELSAAGVL
jgi:hypothetical protein